MHFSLTTGGCFRCRLAPWQKHVADAIPGFWGSRSTKTEQGSEPQTQPPEALADTGIETSSVKPTRLHLQPQARISNLCMCEQLRKWIIRLHLSLRHPEILAEPEILLK